MLHRISWFGGLIFKGIETVGEAVASVIGLDDSKFQDVLDGMTEDEMKLAEEINLHREQEYAAYEVNKLDIQIASIELDERSIADHNDNENSYSALTASYS